MGLQSHAADACVVVEHRLGDGTELDVVFRGFRSHSPPISSAQVSRFLLLFGLFGDFIACDAGMRCKGRAYPSLTPPHPPILFSGRPVLHLSLFASRFPQAVFTNWLNLKLREAGGGDAEIKPQHLSTSLRTGVALIRMLEVCEQGCGKRERER